MPKNKKGGKNFKKRGKDTNDDEYKKELTIKETDQEYAQITKALGNGRMEAYCFDGVTRLCHIRGKMKKKVWMNVGDLILIGLRTYQDGKADIIGKYSAEEGRKLKLLGELPDNAVIKESVNGGEEDEDDIPFEFDDI